MWKTKTQGLMTCPEVKHTVNCKSGLSTEAPLSALRLNSGRFSAQVPLLTSQLSPASGHLLNLALKALYILSERPVLSLPTVSICPLLFMPLLVSEK